MGTGAPNIITWADVGVLASQIERGSNCHITICLSTVSSSPRDGVLSMTVTAKPIAVEKGKRRAQNAVGHYPERSSKSMTGTAIRLLYEVYEKLARADEELRESAQTLLGL
jgi:hypothetical protein